MKKEIDRLIPDAYDVLETVKIAQKGVVNRAWRGQIAAFGSAIQNGSLLAAVAFFSKQGGSDLERPLLLEAIEKMLKLDAQGKDDNREKADVRNKDVKDDGRDGKNAQKNPVNPPERGRPLFNYIHNEDGQKAKKRIINAAVALKLAMNLYDLEKGEESSEEVKETP